MRWTDIMSYQDKSGGSWDWSQLLFGGKRDNVTRSVMEEILGSRRGHRDGVTLGLVCGQLETRGVSPETVKNWVECLNDYKPRQEYLKHEKQRSDDAVYKQLLEAVSFYTDTKGTSFMLTEPTDHAEWIKVPSDEIYVGVSDQEAYDEETDSLYPVVMIRIIRDKPEMCVIASKMPTSLVLEVIKKDVRFNQRALFGAPDPSLPIQIRYETWVSHCS